MIHLTPDGIYADSKEELEAFYDRLHAGDPTILGHLMLYEVEKDLLEESLSKELADIFLRKGEISSAN